MKIIVGLGNPGKDYAATRHNLGFMVVDDLARRFAASESRRRFHADIAEIFVDGEKVVLVKPQTYMNLSGTAVREAAHWYKVATEEILVITDDIDLPFGATRMRGSGGSGGHNGLKSIMAELGADAFPRLRVGVGRGSGVATRQVLGRFNKDEEAELPEVIQAAADCALAWRADGLLLAMNHCNQRPAIPADDASVSGQ